MSSARWTIGILGILLFVVMVDLSAGCGGGGGHHGGGGGSPADLAVTLDPNLDGNSGSVKATTISSADLLDGAGNVREAASLVGPNLALFSLAGLSANTDYFIRINGDSSDLVPARVVQINESTIEEVGTKLTHAIEQVNATLPVTNKDFDFRTYPPGQGDPGIAKYSDGTTESPAQYAYVVLDEHTSPVAFEGRVLGTGVTHAPPYHPANAVHPSAAYAVPWDQWLVGSSRHGKAYTGNDTACSGSGCHGSLDTHVLPASQYGSITPSNGFCYGCHYGKTGGPPIDPSQ